MTLMNKTQNNNLRLATENLKCAPDANLRELWAKAEETEKNTGQTFDEEESPVQNTDYEYYDEAQLNGKLFYIDVRELANCTNTTHRVMKNDGTKPQTIETTTKLTTKAFSSPVTTLKSIHTTQNGMIKSSTTNGLTEATTKKVGDKIVNPNKEHETKDKESFTTVRLATVSAKPLDHNIYDQDMASDEARPEKAKAHRSIQEEMKITPNSNYNNACRNVNSVALVSMILCFRLYFY